MRGARQPGANTGCKPKATVCVGYDEALQARKPERTALDLGQTQAGVPGIVQKESVAGGTRRWRRTRCSGKGWGTAGSMLAWGPGDISAPHCQVSRDTQACLLWTPGAAGEPGGEMSCTLSHRERGLWPLCPEAALRARAPSTSSSAAFPASPWKQHPHGGGQHAGRGHAPARLFLTLFIRFFKRGQRCYACHTHCDFSCPG